MTAALSPAAFLARHNPQGQNSSAGGTDPLHKALAAGCRPIRRCYLGSYMPSQHSRAHDHSSEPSRRLGAAQMLYWRPSSWGAQ
eukprot:3547349-Rhodomonas_salina.1